jgi:hypothetical protein
MSAADDRYNHSEKGRARWRKHWHKRGGGRHQRREREIGVLEGKIEEALSHYPELRALIESRT